MLCRMYVLAVMLSISKLTTSKTINKIVFLFRNYLIDKKRNSSLIGVPLIFMFRYCSVFHEIISLKADVKDFAFFFALSKSVKTKELYH